jgi:hypothetical protein
MGLGHGAGLKWSKLERAANLIKLAAMKKWIAVLAVLVVVAVGAPGCRHAGSREFIPGRGWVPN